MTGRSLPAAGAWTLPRTEPEVAAAAAALGMAVPDACLPGVVANLALLARHAAQVPAGDDRPCD